MTDTSLRTTSRGLFWTLAALSMFGPLSTDMFLPGLPALTRDLHTTAATGNLALTSSVLGLGIGQLIAGPLSDSQGRLRPIRFGLVGYTIASALCAIAPSIWPLIGFRLIQGMCGGSAIVIARAIVRDLFEGVRAARMFAMLIMLSGIAPVIAPLVGGGVLFLSDWRGVFVVLAVIGVLQFLIAERFVPETLAEADRHSGEFSSIVHSFSELIRDRRFAPHVGAFALAFGVMFAWISGGSYVLENVYGLSPQLYSAVFAINALAFAATAQLCVMFLDRASPERLARYGIVAVAVVSVAALVITASHTGIWPLLIVLFLMLAASGVVLPNTISAAMASQEDRLGSASALIGLTQFGFGALLAPFVGIGGSHDALPMGIAMGVCGIAALAVNLMATS